MDQTDKNNLVSLSGAPVFTYTDGEKEWQSPQGEMHLEEISAHIEKHIGPIHKVLHELVSDTVHIDIHHILPNADSPFHILITSGMSDLPMCVPEGYATSRFMELVAVLPADWQISEEAFQDERWYWPIRQLKHLARFPHKNNTWFAFGHSIPNDNPVRPFADNTQLNGTLLLPPLHTPEAFWHLPINDEITINFLACWPLYQEEMDFKLREGSDALLDKFEKYDITELVDIKRKNVAKKRFGVF